MSEDDQARVAQQGGLEHFSWMYDGAVDRAAGEFVVCQQVLTSGQTEDSADFDDLVPKEGLENGCGVAWR